MSEQLYQISSNKIGADDEKIAELKADGILVPVEIDYETAEPAMREFVGWIHSGGSVGPKEYDRIVKAYLKRIVDAALGVTDG